MKIGLLALGLLGMVYSCFAQKTSLFAIQLPAYSAVAVSHDLDYVYQTLQASTYNLFVTTPKAVYDREFNRLKASLVGQDSLSQVETSKLFQRFVALAQLEHCSVAPPFGAVFTHYKASGGTLFPFTVQINGEQVIIKQNYSSNNSFAEGDQILAINGKPIGLYLKDIYSILSGESDYFKSTLVSLYSFPKLLWEVNGQSPVYQVRIKKAGLAVKMVIPVKPILATEFEKRTSGVPSVLRFDRQLRFLDSQTAYFHPGIFLNMGAESTSSHQSFDKGEFIQFLDSAFVQIHQQRSKFLLIDLRGNPGGDDSFSNPMVAYFATKPFTFCSRFSIKTSSLTKQFWKGVTDTTLSPLKAAILSHPDGDIFDFPLPTYPPRADSLCFRGKVYVLINRYSYSNATTTPALIQDYGFGTIVGEPTADCPTMQAAVHDFKLPNTQLSVSYPKAFIIRPNGNTALKGVTPDYQANEDDLTKEDTLLEYTLQLIREKK